MSFLRRFPELSGERGSSNGLPMLPVSQNFARAGEHGVTGGPAAALISEKPGQAGDPTPRIAGGAHEPGAMAGSELSQAVRTVIRTLPLIGPDFDQDTYQGRAGIAGLSDRGIHQLVAIVSFVVNLDVLRAADWRAIAGPSAKKPQAGAPSRVVAQGSGARQAFVPSNSERPRWR